MSHNLETICRVFCDTRIPGNTLSKFKQPIPYEINFPEDYSVGLSSISFPNILLNIREDTVINFAFFKKSTLHDSGEILLPYNGTQFTLISSFSVKIKKGAYLSHKQFTDSILSNFLKTQYPTKLPLRSIFTYKLYQSLGVLKPADLDIIATHINLRIISFVDTASPKRKNKLTYNQTRVHFKDQLRPGLLNVDAGIRNLTGGAKTAFTELVYGEKSSLFWLHIPALKTVLNTPLFEFWYGEPKGIPYSEFTKHRRDARKQFNGELVIEEAIDFFFDKVWAQLCWKDLQAVGDFKHDFGSRGDYLTLKNGLLNIVNSYFLDLKLILNHIHETNAHSNSTTIQEFLRLNKEPYLYNLSDSDIEEEGVPPKKIYTELQYFLNRMYYDKTRFKVVFLPASDMLRKLPKTKRIDSDLIIGSYDSTDVTLFLGADVLIIDKLENICSFQPKICTDTEIYIYLKNIKEQYVNNELLQLFHVIHSGDEVAYGQILQKRYPKPLYLELNNRYLKEFEFEFRTRDGRPAMFDHSTDTVSMVLILRPSARGCI